MNEATVVFYQQSFLPALRRLDALLEEACQTAELISGYARDDRFRGLYVDQTEIAHLFSRSPGHPHLWSQNGKEAPDKFSFEPPSHSPIAWLSRTFNLTPFDCDVLLLAAAPEIDRRYERIYAYLQDHVARKRPFVDLALNLLSADAVVRLAQRRRFAPKAPLRKHRLIHLLPEREHEQPSLLAHALKVDPLVVQLLLGQPQLDERLTTWADYTASLPQEPPITLSEERARRLATLTRLAQEQQNPCCLHFHGPRGVGKRQTAIWLAAQLQTPILELNLQRLCNSQADWRESLRIALRQQHFQRCVLWLSPVDALMHREFTLHATDLMALIAKEAQGITILSGQRPFLPQTERPLNVLTLPFDIPGTHVQRSIWQTQLDQHGLSVDTTTINDLATRFRLTPQQIEMAVCTAHTHQAWQCLGENEPETVVTPKQLFAAARNQCGHDLVNLAQKISPIYTWNDIVLPDETKTQLHEINRRVAHRYQVLHEWGFASKLSLGRGTSTLFSGPSGTGKTMAAEIISHELGLDLYKIDLSGVVSKYVGETEKNLDRIFKAAENANAILFFDEADALFGKRSEVRDSHDRYANIEISYLLQKMEEYPGLTILATNLRQNLDDAFVRRLAFMVHFPFPDETSRAQIWQRVWPDKTPLHENIDLELLAHRFKLSGGSIKNIALAAAFLAADDSSQVTMSHLYQAARREYQKMGKAISLEEIELG